MKTGLFFGSFNPVHIGHLIISQYILNEAKLDRIKFVVSPHNPLKEKITRTIKVPLYYTGLTDKAIVSIKDSKPTAFKLNRNYEIELTLSIEAESYNWVIIE